jgi:hypothetical protein
MALVFRAQTKPTHHELALALRNAFRKVAYMTPFDESIALLFAQWAFETGWGKACWNWNLGNARASKEWIATGHDYVELPTADEIVDGKRVIVGGYFRSHRSLEEGAISHIELLAGLARYQKAFMILEMSPKGPIEIQARQFVRALKEGGYFTGNEYEYAEGVASIAKGFLAGLTSWDDPLPIHALDPSQFLDWQPIRDVQTAMSMIFVDERHKILTNTLSCRYDCEEAA